jgi:hypothetical protein
MGTKNGRGKRLIHGVGINDVDAPTESRENGKRVKNGYYVLWREMLARCYSLKRQKYRPNYVGCTVHPDWHKFSNFKKWVDTQPQVNWRELYLDKDLLTKSNKLYGPDTCCFLTNQENNLFRLSVPPFCNITFQGKNRIKAWLVTMKTMNKTTYIGYYSTKEEASVVGARVGIERVIHLANANPHQFIRDAMFRWIGDWKQELLLLESNFQKLGEQNNGTLQDHLC